MLAQILQMRKLSSILFSLDLSSLCPFHLLLPLIRLSLITTLSLLPLSQIKVVLTLPVFPFKIPSIPPHAFRILDQL